MTRRDTTTQLVKYLTDAHSIEQQALAQLVAAPSIVEDDALAQAFAMHCRETEGHERLVRDRLQAHGVSPNRVKDGIGTITGKGFTAFARSQPDTPGKLVAHAYSYEHMELAAYIQLARVAELSGDDVTADVARRIAAQEQTMADRLASLFDVVAAASLDGVADEDLGAQLDKYLQDAHAIEGQAFELLGRAPKLAGDDELASAYALHRNETAAHVRWIEKRLLERSAAPSRLKDAALRLGALNWSLFFAAQPDTPAKLAAFAFAFEHLEIASYELLRRVAARAGDRRTEELAERLLVDEREAAKTIRGLFGRALAASLAQLGVAA